MFRWQERTWTCGPAAFRIALEEFGILRTEKYLAKILNSTPKKGTRNKDFVRAAKHFHLDFIIEHNSSISAIDKLLRKNYRVVVCYFSAVNETGHYAVVKRISKKRIFLVDPSLGPGLSYSRSHFNKIWHGKYEVEKKWFIALRKN